MTKTHEGNTLEKIFVKKSKFCTQICEKMAIFRLFINFQDVRYLEQSQNKYI